MKKALVMMIVVLSLGVSLTAGAACVAQPSGPFVYTVEEHK